jgi:hypothetical protein
MNGRCRENLNERPAATRLDVIAKTDAGLLQGLDEHWKIVDPILLSGLGCFSRRCHLFFSCLSELLDCGAA